MPSGHDAHTVLATFVQVDETFAQKLMSLHARHSVPNTSDLKYPSEHVKHRRLSVQQGGGGGGHVISSAGDYVLFQSYTELGV
jgi:hypothetical protein